MQTNGETMKLSNHREQIADQVAMLGDDVKGLGGLVGDAARDGVVTAKERSIELVDQGREKIKHASRKVEERASEKPLETAGVALVAGLALGAWLGRRFLG